jgi:signal transduction histidine kinase
MLRLLCSMRHPGQVFSRDQLIAAVSNGASVEVEVADSGEGLDPDDRERVFEPSAGPQRWRPLRRGRRARLSICWAIVEAHGGDIWVASSAGGTRVRFSLPTLA